MEMLNKVKTLCENAVSGRKVKTEDFYKTLRAIADDENTDDDLACIIEDGLMELELAGDAATIKAVKEAANMILEGCARISNG